MFYRLCTGILICINVICAVTGATVAPTETTVAANVDCKGYTWFSSGGRVRTSDGTPYTLESSTHVNDAVVWFGAAYTGKMAPDGLSGSNPLAGDLACSSTRPLLCVSKVASRNTMKPSFLDEMANVPDEAMLDAFWNNEWDVREMRLTKNAYAASCLGLRQNGDALCAADHGADFEWYSPGASFGAWARYSSSVDVLSATTAHQPPVRNTRVWVHTDIGDIYSQATSDCGVGVTFANGADECWTHNVCDANDYCEDTGTAPGNASQIFCSGRSRSPSTHVLQQCGTLLDYDLCVDFTIDEACQFDLALRNGEQVVAESDLGVELASLVCGNFSVASALPPCEACALLTSNSSDSGCVDLSLSCGLLRVDGVRVGCFANSEPFRRCVQSEERECPNACSGHGECDRLRGVCSCTTGYFGDDCASEVEGDFERCLTFGSLAPPICVNLHFEECELDVSVTFNSRLVYGNAYDVADLVNVPDGFDFPLDACLGQAQLPCDVCVSFKDFEANDDIVRGCGVVNATCFDQFLGALELGCFEDTQVVPQCFDLCGSRADCNDRGECTNGFCDCEAPWHGQHCTYQCDKDCSGNGQCVAPMRCVCDDGFDGADCAVRSDGNATTRVPRTTSATQQTAAQKEECPNQCSFHGDCFRGKCICLDGYIGDDCSEVPGDSGVVTALIVVIVVLVVLILCAVGCYVLRGRRAAPYMEMGGGGARARNSGASKTGDAVDMENGSFATPSERAKTGLESVEESAESSEEEAAVEVASAGARRTGGGGGSRASAARHHKRRAK